MPQEDTLAERPRAADPSLLERAAAEVGTTLDLFRTAREFADVAASGPADIAVVELLDSVLHGEAPAPGPIAEPITVRRAALAAADPACVSGVHDVGDAWRLRFGSPFAEALTDLRPRLVRRLAPGDPWVVREPDRARLTQLAGVHSMMAVPLVVRGVVLGMASFYRVGASPAFDDADVGDAVALAAFASVCLDNARRHTREKALARLVQRTLVPRRLPAHVAAETAWTYLPVAAGGSWFDVVPLSGARIACVVGEVDGHGMPAVSLMGQVSTAVAALAAVDLEPDELLARVHNLVLETAMTQQLAPSGDPAASDVLTVGCVLAVYDPVAATCTVARAGHCSPTLVLPDGRAHVLDAPAGPPLGGRGEPRFPHTTVELPAGSVVALHTASVREDLAPALARALDASGDDLGAACDTFLAQAFPDGPDDDTLLFLARTRVLGPERTATWTFPDRPESAAEARRATARQLADWDLGDLAVVAELVVSELVTNAVRYSDGPIELRLIVRESSLACEVTDGNSAAPRLRRAQDDDEGGRGLFLVARFTDDWGVRPMARGKTIWAELALPGQEPADPEDEDTDAL